PVDHLRPREIFAIHVKKKVVLSVDKSDDPSNVGTVDTKETAPWQLHRKDELATRIHPVVKCEFTAAAFVPVIGLDPLVSVLKLCHASHRGRRRTGYGPCRQVDGLRNWLEDDVNAR